MVFIKKTFQMLKCHIPYSGVPCEQISTLKLLTATQAQCYKTFYSRNSHEKLEC
jgi:hypothetical protein